MTIKEMRWYEEDLALKQKEHLEKVRHRNWQPCLHDQCPECIGTGIKSDGSACIHHISCHCPKCSPTMSTDYSPGNNYNITHGTSTYTYQNTTNDYDQNSNQISKQ